MKSIICFIGVAFLLSFTVISSVYDLRITLGNGEDISLSAFAGKTMMIVVLPAIKNETNTAILRDLDSMHVLYADSITMIGIPSYEDGYADDSLQSLLAWYGSVLDTSFIIAQGMNTRKISPYQSNLFNWLTHAEENGHFDNDTGGAGEKFFISKAGELYGLVSPDLQFNQDIIEELLNN